MKNLRNKVQLIGNLGADPEVREFESGKTVVTMSLATTESYRNKNGDYSKEVQWHKVIAWNNLAKSIGKYLKKGNEVVIDGKLNHRTYEGNDGKQRKITEVVANDFIILKRKAEARA